jgi:class 3 adenylate cyclase
LDRQILSEAETARELEFKEMENTAKCLVPPSQVQVLVGWLRRKRTTTTGESALPELLAHVLPQVVVCFVEIHLGESGAGESASALLLASQLTTALEECIVEARPSNSDSPVERIKMIGDAALLVGPLDFGGLDSSLMDPHTLQIAIAHMLNTLCALQRRVVAASRKFGDVGDRHHPAGGVSTVYLKGGLSVGSVVAAVVGRTGLMFDVFGDSVNRASRSKLQCPPGSIAFEFHEAIEKGLAPLVGKFKQTNRYDTHFKGIPTPIDLCVFAFL